MRGSNDSTTGKLMGRIGGVLKKDDLVKGRKKRREAGLGQEE